MNEKLIEKLWDYIIENNPDLMFSLQEDYSVRSYLDDKVNTIQLQLEQWQHEDLPPDLIEERSMEALTKDLKPSKFHYIRNILEEEFETEFSQFKEAGTLTYHVVNIIEASKEIFEAIKFSEHNKGSRRLRKVIIATITKHIESK